jgi:streptogramin lyase
VKRSSKTIERPAEVLREYGPFPGGDNVRGVTFDGKDVWFATGHSIQSFDPADGRAKKALPVAADAGTAFDGEHLFQLAGETIQKIDPHTGQVLKSVPAPGKGQHAGLTWAEGSLWVAHHGEGKIHRVDPETGKVLRTLDGVGCVTGVTWADGDLWHGTYEDSRSDVRRIDPDSGEVLERLVMPEGTMVAGLEAAGEDLFYCGGGRSGKVRAVRRPKRK